MDKSAENWLQDIADIMKSNTRATWLAATCAVVSLPLSVIAIILALH